MISLYWPKLHLTCQDSGKRLRALGPFVFEKKTLKNYFTNSVDPDEMPLNVASHQNLACLLQQI